MKHADLAAMTVAELKALAKKKKTALAPGATKAAIIKALSRPVTSSAVTPKKKAAKKAATKSKKTKKAASKKTGAKKSAVAKPTARAAKGAKTGAKRTPAKKISATAPAGIPAVRPEVPREWQAPIQERIAGAKYFTGHRDGGEVAPSLPASYGDERMVIMSRDPFVLFGYWEISQERLDRERARLGAGAKLCVRIYDITGRSFDGSNATATFDQEVYERAGSWYFHLARPSHRFCADIGLLAPDGGFQTLSRSNTVSMPRETVSEQVDDSWMISDEAFLKLHGLSHGIGGVSSAQIGDVLRAARMHEMSSHGLFSRQGQSHKRK